MIRLDNFFLILFTFTCFLYRSQDVKRQKKLKDSEKSIYEVFDNLGKVDQQFVVLRNTPDTIKKIMYASNLNIISIYIEKGYFSKDSMNNYSMKTFAKINRSTSIILFHLIKYSPELIFNDYFINFLEAKFNNNFFPKRLIMHSLERYYTLVAWDKFHPESKEYELVKRFDHQYDDLFYEALRRWRIDESTLNHDAIKFIGH